MPALSIDHLNITTANLEAARNFYREVLGMEDGPRPPFARPGAWMYLSGRPVLHISTGRVPTTRSSDSFGHVAFSAAGLAQTREALRSHGVRFEEFAVPDQQLHQVFFRDPDGTQIELVYSGEEARQALRDGARVDATVGRTI